MTAIAGTVSYLTTIYVTAASSGDGDTIAAVFNGVKFPSVDITDAATATNASGVVTITWPSTSVRCGQQAALSFVVNTIAGITTLTTPVTHAYVRTEGKVI